MIKRWTETLQEYLKPHYLLYVQIGTRGANTFTNKSPVNFLCDNPTVTVINSWKITTREYLRLKAVVGARAKAKP